MSYPPAVTHRILFLLVLPLGLFGLGCSTDDSAQDGGADGAHDGPIDLCDVDAFSGSGNACAHLSDRVCFPQCTTGGCKCAQGATGPVWKCTSDFSCVPDSGPLDDAAPDDATPDDAATDGGVDAATD
ncbi:MAG TPA: hypothetical protein VF316_05710 [Polyangiaceae bacterium]